MYLDDLLFYLCYFCNTMVLMFLYGLSYSYSAIIWSNTLLISRNSLSSETTLMFLTEIILSCFIRKWRFYGCQNLFWWYILHWGYCKIRKCTAVKYASEISIQAPCSWKNLEYGVPQGSILGPLLFNIHLCDLFYFLDDLDIVSYADDTTLCTVKENIESVINVLETSSQKLFK